MISSLNVVRTEPAVVDRELRLGDCSRSDNRRRYPCVRPEGEQKFSLVLR